MSIFLTPENTPQQEVMRSLPKTLSIYITLAEAAQHDIRDDCGGTTGWSIKGLSSVTGLHRTTIAKYIGQLLDAGFIQITGEEFNRGGSHNTLFRVTTRENLEPVRHAISMMNQLPSQRLAAMRTKAVKPVVNETRSNQSYKW